MENNQFNQNYQGQPQYQNQYPPQNGYPYQQGYPTPPPKPKGMKPLLIVLGVIAGVVAIACVTAGVIYSKNIASDKPAESTENAYSQAETTNAEGKEEPTTESQTKNTAKQKNTALLNRLIGNEFVDVMCIADTFGESSRSLTFKDEKTVKFDYSDEVSQHTKNVEYTINGDTVSVHVDTKYYGIDYTIMDNPNSSMLKCFCRVQYDNDGKKEVYTTDGFLTERRNLTKSDGARIYEALGNKYWTSSFIEGETGAEGIDVYVEDWSSPYFTGTTTDGKAEDDLYGYALTDNVAVFDSGIGTFLIESYKGKTIGYFFEENGNARNLIEEELT